VSGAKSRSEATYWFVSLLEAAASALSSYGGQITGTTVWNKVRTSLQNVERGYVLDNSYLNE
jgi:hypothetical protein